MISALVRTVSIATVAVGLLACAGPLRYELASTPKAPGADAVLVADVNAETNQSSVTLKIKNLPPAARVSAGATVYVAWYRRSAETVWARIGGLAYDESDRSATLEGSVPERAFDFEVTAEKTPSVASPSPDVVLAQRVARQP